MPYFEHTVGTLTPIMRGFAVSLLLLTGAIPAIFAGQLADQYGQLRVVMAGASVFTLGAVLQAACDGLTMLLIGRALAGLGEGLWLSNVSVYVALTPLTCVSFPPVLTFPSQIHHRDRSREP